MRFEWDDQKNESNLKKHGIRFSAATAVFDDPWFLMELDRIEDGETRWRTIGELGGSFLVLVIHLLEDNDANDEEVVRMISARQATAAERRHYERSI